MSDLALAYDATQQAFVATQGRWAAIPTGPWCAPVPPQATTAYAHAPKESWRSAPVLTPKTAAWWSLTEGGDTIALRLHTWAPHALGRGRKAAYATPLDAWAAASAQAQVLPAQHWTLARDATPTATLRHLHAVLSVRSAALLDALEALLEGVLGKPATDTILAPARALLQSHTQEIADAAARTRAATRKNATRGGNPKAYKEGDRIVALTPIAFLTTTHQAFWYVRDAALPSQPPGFYAERTPEGWGTGSRYTVPKARARRACPVAFDEVTCSRHQQMVWLAEQQAVEARRAQGLSPYGPR